MTAVQTPTIRSLFAPGRNIDRPIEKVIDYYATDDKRLLAEVEEYEVTANVERNLRRFLDVFGAGVRTGQVTETGIWVSGFYGSGKSSFTKYLGFALDTDRLVAGRPFVDLLAERIDDHALRQELRTLAAQEPAAVIMLDLGAEQLAANPSATVANVLYWKVLQWAGYSKEEKLAQLEFRLERDGRLEEFKRAYRDQYGGDWNKVHNDPLVGVAHADRIVPQFYPQEFPEPNAFRSLRFSLAGDVRDRAAEMLDLITRRTHRRNVLFLIDEAGQYVAPRGDLILNLDGLARNFKELGKGRVWMVATGQQTLTEIVERAALNSADLNKLRDRFPIGLELDAQDIREITWKRLLAKSTEGSAALSGLYRQHGQALAANTRLEGTALFKAELSEETFVRLYPFLPQHFDLLLELVRVLASSTGGIGLRSAIRVIQDLLVDASHVLLPGTPLLADMPFGRLATADQFFDTLRADIGKSMAHVVTGVDRAGSALPGDELALRVAKAVGALQPIDNFPRTAENIAALLYRRIGDAPHLDEVRAALRRLLDAREVGLVDDPQTGGYTFLSEGVKPIRDKRNSYMPTTGELNLLRSRIVASLFDPLPSATLENAKVVRAGVQWGRIPIVGEEEEVHFRIEIADGASWDQRRTALLTDTTGNTEWKAAIAWLMQPDAEIEDKLVEVVRSRKVVNETSEAQADRAVAQFIRSERAAAEANEDRARTLYRQALLQGTLIFRGKPTPASVAGTTVDAAARKVLQDAAAEIYPYFHLVNIRPGTDLAAKFLGVERLERMPKEADPLGFVATTAGRARVNAQHPALAEALRVFREKLHDAGTTRLQGNAIQDLFAAAPYGWSKDATRYVFAGLLAGGEVILHTSSGEVKTAGPAAIEALKNTQAFGKVGVSLRDTKVPIEMLERAASRLERLLGREVLPLEDHISRAVRDSMPKRLAAVASVPGELRLLGLGGSARAQEVYDTGNALLGEDGVAAIAILGASECTVPDDMDWLGRVKTALESDTTTADVGDARSLIKAADALHELFPSVTLVEGSESTAVKDILASDTFFDRLADLRTIARRVRDRAKKTYHEYYVGYQKALADVRTALESLPAWVRISDDDRQDIGNRLLSGSAEPPRDGQVATVLETPEAGKEIAQLQLLLVRRSGIPDLLRQLEGEVARRVPALTISEAGPDEPVDLDLASVAPQTVIRTDEDLDNWLDALRAAVANARAAGAPVRIKVTR